MKILVLTCSTGGGHNSCAKYIKEEFDLNNIECDVKDFFDIVGSKLSKKVEKIYIASTKGNGKAFKYIYKLGETYNKTDLKSPVYELVKLSKNKIYDYITENKYDIIICTHLFPSMAITKLKKDGKNIKLINVATDYSYIPFWNETNPDYFVIPHESLKKEFIKKGMDEKIFLPFGIPVSTNFQKVKNIVKVPKDKDIVLLSSGSMGFGKMDKIVKKLLKQIPNIYLIVVCGNNKKMYNKLSKIKNENLCVKGFINNMNEYMKVSKIILSKPGGLSTSEIVTLNKPLNLIMPIPGIENYNAEFFFNNKLSLVSNTLDEVILNTKLLLKDEKLQKELILNQKNMINKNSASDLVNFVKNNM